MQILNILFDSIGGLFEIVLKFYEFIMSVFKIGIIISVSYCASMILVDFPCSVVEAIIKRSIPEKASYYLKIGITIFLTGLAVQAVRGSFL